MIKIIYEIISLYIHLYFSDNFAFDNAKRKILNEFKSKSSSNLLLKETYKMKSKLMDFFMFILLIKNFT